MKHLLIKIMYMVPLICLLVPRIHANNEHMQVDPITHAITISHLFFDQEIAHILDRLAHEDPGQPDIAYCNEAIKQKNECIDGQRTVKALMAVTAYLEQNIKAPRPTPEIDGSIVGPLLECDVFRILALLQILENAIITCCNQLQIDFNGTFTELMAIRDSFTTCCAAIEQDLAGTFTTLTDIFNTLTTCCATSIASATTLEAIIINDFNGTFSTIADIKNTLTICCNAIEINFQGTFTALAAAQVTCTSGACNPIAISASTTITTSGFYCLTQDIIGAITIASDDVLLDLNDHTVIGAGAGSGAGIAINSGLNNIAVKNGRIVDWDFGITGTDLTAALFENIETNSCAVSGISILNGSQLHFNLITASEIGTIGLHFSGIFADCQLQNVTVSHAQQGIVFGTLNDGLFQNCNVFDCSVTGGATISNVEGIGIAAGGSNIQFDNCSVKNYTTNTAIQTTGIGVFNCTNVIHRNCVVQAIFNEASVGIGNGFLCDGSCKNVQYINCIATLMTSNLSCNGFNINAQEATLRNCCADLILLLASSVSVADGFFCGGGDYALINCEAYRCFNTGFDLTGGGNILAQNCQAAYNDVGFDMGAPGANNTIVNYSVAFRNDSIGFQYEAPTRTFRCFATQNGINYNGFPLNVQNANTQVDTTAPGLTGPFAGPNLFI